MQVHADRRRRESRAIGDFSAAHPFDQPKNQRLPVRVGKRSHRFENRERLQMIRVADRHVVRERLHHVKASSVIRRAVPGDRREPSSECGRLAEFV